MFYAPARYDCDDVYNLSLEYMHPESAEWAMRKNLQSKIKLQEKITMKDQFRTLKTARTNDIQCFTVKVFIKVTYRIIRFIIF